MQRTKWIAAGVAGVVLLLILISGKRQETSPPSFQGPNRLVYDSGMICLEGESTPYGGPVEKLYPNGKKKYSLEIVDGVKQGRAIQWYQNGKKKAEVTLKDGQPIGTMLGWHENGKKSYEMPLVKGVAEGIVTEYGLNGKPRSETHYVKGKKHGKEIGFDQSNNKLWETTWVQDKIEGEYVKFYPSGQKRSITTYANGLRDGLETGFFKNGGKSWIAKWRNEKPVGTHMEWHQTKEGKPRLSRQQSFSEAQLVLLLEWHKNGQQSMEAEYSNGRLLKQIRWNTEGKELLRMGIETPSQAAKAPENSKPTITNPDAVGRKRYWRKNDLIAVYRDKDIKTILIVFGEPDQKLGDTWVYNKMNIFDPALGRRYSTAQFLIKENKVLIVEVR